ncbi:MAG: hypothetical protein VKJ04_09085, partial [Vampirovibrionales bacterium]|nr:hypothetical protein [Vampirovibrionales bacterium]
MQPLSSSTQFFSNQLQSVQTPGQIPGVVQAFQPAAATPGTFPVAPAFSNLGQSNPLNVATRVGDSSVFNRMPFDPSLLSGINLLNPPGSINNPSTLGAVTAFGSSGLSAAGAFGLGPAQVGTPSPISGFNGLGSNLAGNLGLPIPGLSGTGNGLGSLGASSFFGFNQNPLGAGNDISTLLTTLLSGFLSSFQQQAPVATVPNQPAFIAVPVLDDNVPNAVGQEPPAAGGVAQTPPVGAPAPANENKTQALDLVIAAVQAEGGFAANQDEFRRIVDALIADPANAAQVANLTEIRDAAASIEGARPGTGVSVTNLNTIRRNLVENADNNLTTAIADARAEQTPAPTPAPVRNPEPAP